MVLFLDLDGTIIGSNGVAESTFEAIDAARAQGLKMAVCTGRPGAGVALEIARRISDGPHIFESGAVVKSSAGEVFMSETLDTDSLMTLIAHSKTTPAVLEFYTPNGVFVSRNNADCRRHAEVLDIEFQEASLEEVARTGEVVRAHWIMRPENKEQTLSLELPTCEIGVASSPVLPENVFASITRRGVSKGVAAAFVADRYGVSLESCWGVGDSDGDLPLLEVVGRGWVMAEANAGLRGRFEVLPGVDEGGVALAIEQALKESAS